MTNSMTLHGPDGNDILAERTNLNNHPIDNDRYIYMLCACPIPLNIVWKFETPKHAGYYYGICPDCKEVVGKFVYTDLREMFPGYTFDDWSVEKGLEK